MKEFSTTVYQSTIEKIKNTVECESRRKSTNRWRMKKKKRRGKKENDDDGDRFELGNV